MSLLSGQGLFVTAVAGLNQTYSTLTNGKNDGLTLDQIVNPGSDVNVNGLNYSFLSYLSSNFGAIAGKDGKITAQDIQNLGNKFSTQGMTYNEIAQLCGQGANNTLLSTVLTYFPEIDKNGDGRVTDAEIRAFGYESDKSKMELEYGSFNPSNMSIFYSDNDSSAYKPTSLLDYKYPTDNSNST